MNQGCFYVRYSFAAVLCLNVQVVSILKELNLVPVSYACLSEMHDAIEECKIKRINSNSVLTPTVFRQKIETEEIYCEKKKEIELSLFYQKI